MTPTPATPSLLQSLDTAAQASPHTPRAIAMRRAFQVLREKGVGPDLDVVRALTGEDPSS